MSKSMLCSINAHGYQKLCLPINNTSYVFSMRVKAWLRDRSTEKKGTLNRTKS